MRRDDIHSYPFQGVYPKTGLVILFTAWQRGDVLKRGKEGSSDHSKQIGHHSSSWNMTVFEEVM